MSILPCPVHPVFARSCGQSVLLLLPGETRVHSERLCLQQSVPLLVLRACLRPQDAHKMAPAKVWQSPVLFVLSLLIPGVMCADTYTIAGLVASAAIAFVFLVVVIVMLVVGLTWNNWYPTLQRGRGKVKMPRDYWKKKEEARMRLISGSRSLAPSEAGLPNGGTVNRVHDTDDRSDGASWVQGWNNAHPPPSARPEKAYEEKDLTMVLGDEEDFRIETSVVEGETLDLGPFHDNDSPRQQRLPPPSAVPQSTDIATMQLDDEEEGTQLYSVVGRPGRDQTEEAVTSFSKLDPDLVAF